MSLEQKIAAQILSGHHQEALQELARAYLHPLARFCAGLTGIPAEAEELVQETFIEALQAMPQFRAESTARAWLFGIARRICQRHERRRKRRQFLFVRWFRSAPPEESPDLAFEGLEEQKLLHQALQAIKPYMREAILLRFQQELAYDEVAEVLEIRPAAARKRVSLGLQALRKVLYPHMLEPPAPTRRDTPPPLPPFRADSQDWTQELQQLLETIKVED